jgi:uncharacterized protein
MEWTAYWYMFPIALGIAILAMATGIEGATFFSPIFMLVLQLEPRLAIGTALLTATFGFGSGISAYIRNRLIDYRLAGELLLVTVPLALIGASVAGWLSAVMLKSVFGLGLLTIGVLFWRSPSAAETRHRDEAIRVSVSPARAERRLVSARGEEICYTVCNRSEGMAMCGLGGLFMGLIGSGQGEMNSYFLLRRCRVPSQVAIATGTFVVAITTLAASLSYLVSFVHGGSGVMIQVLNLAIYTVPAVVIGGQIGPLISSRLEKHKLEQLLALVFVLIGALTLWVTWQPLFS